MGSAMKSVYKEVLRTSLLLFLCIAAILGLTPVGPGYAATAREIDVSVDVSWSGSTKK